MIGLGVSPSTSRATAINNDGVVVGHSDDAYAFMWDQGTITWLGSLMTNGWSEATDINDSGQIVGWSSAPGSNYRRAFVWENGLMTAIPNLGDSHSTAVSINEFGMTVGVFENGPQSFEHAFLWDNGTTMELPPAAAGSGARAADINSARDVVGSSGMQGVVWRDGVVEYLDSPACYGCGGPFASNDYGQIVGAAGSPEGPRAIIWYGGVRYELNRLVQPDSPFRLETGVDVNAMGQVLCSANGPGPQIFYSVLLTPIDCDIDTDGIVSLADFQGWPECLSGPQQELAPSCVWSDFDHDLDVDLLDFRSFELAMESR